MGAAGTTFFSGNTVPHPTSHGMLMILLWLLCVGLVLGGLLAGLSRQVPWSTLRFQRMRVVRGASPSAARPVRLLASGLRGRSLSPPDTDSRAGPPGPFGGLG